MIYNTASYLIHYGIRGQRKGIRRFQNEDGTLTPEGKERYGIDDGEKKEIKNAYDTSKKRNEYLKTLNSEQRQVYNSLQYRDQKKLWKKLSQGKDFDKACREMNREAAITALGVTAALLYINPVTRGFMKSLGKHAMQAVKNSNIVKKGSLWMKKFMTRRSMMKNGAVVLKKSAYSVRDIPFGGYLSR